MWFSSRDILPFFWSKIGPPKSLKVWPKHNSCQLTKQREMTSAHMTWSIFSHSLSFHLTPKFELRKSCWEICDSQRVWKSQVSDVLWEISSFHRKNTLVEIKQPDVRAILRDIFRIMSDGIYFSSLKSNRTYPSIVTIAMQIILQSQPTLFVELSVSLFLEAVSSYIEKADKRSGQQ